MSEKPWYSAGLRFECQACGGCCTGDPGYVWVDPEEIVALARALAFPKLDFEQRLVRTIGRKKSLREFPNGDCVIFDTEKRGCRAYEARPAQCRTWPFWASNLESLESWEDTALQCPGCNMGDVVPLEDIEKRVNNTPF
jgi:uncharacterized protein